MACHLNNGMSKDKSLRKEIYTTIPASVLHRRVFEAYVIKGWDAERVSDSFFSFSFFISGEG